jgi:hypothetical protein
MDEEGQAPPIDERKQRIIWFAVALGGAVLAGLLLASSVWTGQWKSDGNAVGNEMVETKAFNAESWCAAQTTYDAIRHELFRRAAQVRGSDEQAYTRLADFALLRVSGPVVQGVDDRVHSVTCAGTAFLDLPPDVSAAGGRRTLTGDLDYIIQPAADGTGNVIRIGNADSIVIPLATLSRTGVPQSAPLFPPELGNAVTPATPDGIEEGRADDPDDAEEPDNSTEDLDSLEGQVAGQFAGAMAQADDEQRGLLQRTERRFRAIQRRCATQQCVAQTYQSRTREISDIMAGRWRG